MAWGFSAITSFDALHRSIGNAFLHLTSDSHSSSDSCRIAIIGSSGYIGSRLLDHLRDTTNCTVIGYDRIFKQQASWEIPTRTIRTFDVVIYLGGLTGRAMCQQHPTEVERENVQDIIALAKRMLPSQLLLFASTSAIAEGSESVSIDETAPIQYELLDLYSGSLLRREQLLRQLSSEKKNTPRMIGLRFGTIIGFSPSQRIDLTPMALICQAFLYGKIRVTPPESNRAYLTMEDLMSAFSTIIKHFTQVERFDIFHLQSFSASISYVVNTVASLTGAYINTYDHPQNQDSFGFALNNSKFCKTFNFTFAGNLNHSVSTMILNVPRMCIGRQSRLDNSSVPCVVCGSHTMYTVLDLHKQPLANDFRTNVEDSITSERFPLRLVRCPICHHTQLSYIVNRTYLFSHYLYQSGTSNSLKKYFAWLADKVVKASTVKFGTVIEIACNDGSQLNEFLQRGWKTIGIDPTKNLADIARTNGHTIYTGFWGVDTFPGLSSLKNIDAIIAQNVLAHVADPVRFLRACAAIMRRETKLYIQTSQCEMYETGQFDTVYHEHVSFFTAHSFKKLADLARLVITHFEITPIHGRSCLVTFELPESNNISLVNFNDTKQDASLSFALQKELNLSIVDPWFYIKYEAQAQGMREWISHQLTVAQARDHTIVAYGAAAKGIVILHFLLEIPNRLWNISFVVDDAPLKQNTFCPGTSIPVHPTSELSKLSSTKPLTIIVFAWNFRDEIITKIRSATINKGLKNIFIIFPFPQQEIVRMDEKRKQTVAENINKPLSWQESFHINRRPLLLISHFFNEEFLLPYWIRHHAPMFDMAILIDYNSTDRSREIIQNEAPGSWKVFSSKNAVFDAALVDDEVVEYEKLHPYAWKIVLNTPEFLVHRNLRQMLAKSVPYNATLVFRFRSIIMSGNDSIPLKRFTSLLKQRSQYTYNPGNPEERFGVTSYSRFIHCYQYVKYSVGRHSIGNDVWHWAPSGFIAKYQYTPWPEIIGRKLQIRSRMPPTDIALGRGFQHNVNLPQLEQKKRRVQLLPQHNLNEFDADSDELAMAHRLWKELIDQ